MSTRKFSLLIAGFIWIIVGIRIGSRSIEWLEPYFNPPSWQLIFLVLSVIVGFLKAKTVLRKAVTRSIGNSENIDDHFTNYFIGWLKLFGLRGIIVISLMIGMGFGLRALKAGGFDPYNSFGFIYLAVSLALVGASSFYFQAASKENANH